MIDRCHLRRTSYTPVTRLIPSYLIHSRDVHCHLLLILNPFELADIFSPIWIPYLRDRISEL